jgi:hypothetical protein
MKKDFQYFIQGPASFVVKAKKHFGCAEIAAADPYIFPGFITPKDVFLSKVNFAETSNNVINAINTALIKD